MVMIALLLKQGLKDSLVHYYTHLQSIDLCESDRLFLCGVNLIHVLYLTGEAMEKGLRDCCRSIRIGKILIKINEETKAPMVKTCTFKFNI